MDALSYVKNHIDAGHLFHSYIISGSDSQGRLSAAMYIGKTALCREGRGGPCGKCTDCRKVELGIHPDITVVRKAADEKNLTVATMCDVRSRASVMPNEGDRSVFIIEDSDTMNLQAQNAMLKILEEPPEYSMFLLLADNVDRLIPTVRSRCEIITLPHEESYSPCREGIDILSAAVKNSGWELAAAIMAVSKLNRGEILNLITTLRRETARHMAEGTLSEELCEKVISACDECEGYMDVNVSAGYVSSRLLAAFFG